MNVLNPSAIIFVILVGVLTAPPGAGAETCPPQCASGKVPLGIIAPTSGPPAAFGRQAVKPAEIAVAQLNAAGGLMGIPVTLVVADDRCDSGSAIEAAKRQVERDKINVVIGPICPAAAEMAAPVYSEAGVIQFLPTVPTIGFGRQRFDRVFRLIATDEQEARALGSYLSGEHKGKKLTIAYTDAFYRRSMIDMIKAAVPAEMKSEIQFEPLMDTSTAYDRLIDRLKRSPPDLIYLALDNVMLLEFVTKLRKRGLNAHLAGGQRLYSQSFLADAGEAAAGIDILAPIGPLNNPDLLKAVDLLRRAEVTPDLVALNTYAAIQTWTEAVRRAGSNDPEKLAQLLRSDDFPTAIGNVSFDASGARRNVHFSTLTWQGGWLKTGTRP